MPGADRIAVQQDFGGGANVAVRPELVPDNALVAAVNGLYDNVGNIYRRGGSTYRSATQLPGGGPLTFLWDGWLTAGQRTVMANAITFGTDTAGVVASIGGGGLGAPVRPAVLSGKLFIPGGTTYDGTTVGTATTVAPLYAVVATRLLTASGNRVGFSDFNDPTTVDPTDEWLIPGGVQIVGLEGLRDAAAVFTTDGIWIIYNLHLDLTDADGNFQQRLDRYSSDIVLWGAAGIASWQGALVVPALDAVWLLSLGIASEASAPFQRISDDIAPLYQDYVRRGYKPGIATVYRSHYILPILAGTTPVDLLVCRLDARDRGGRQTWPWSSQKGVGAQVTAVAVHNDVTTSRPTLMGASADVGRLLDLSFLEPSAEVPVDADGSTFALDALLRSYTTGSLNENTATKLRAAYQLTPGPPTIELEGLNEWGDFDWGSTTWRSSAEEAVYPTPTIKAFAIDGAPPPGDDWGLFDWGEGDWSTTSTEVELAGEAPVDVAGTEPYTWTVALQRRFVQFRLRSEGSAASVKLKGVELFGRRNGRL